MLILFIWTAVELKYYVKTHARITANAIFFLHDGNLRVYTGISSVCSKNVVTIEVVSTSCYALTVCDDLWCLRFLIVEIIEMFPHFLMRSFGIDAEFACKWIDGNWSVVRMFSFDLGATPKRKRIVFGSAKSKRCGGCMDSHTIEAGHSLSVRARDEEKRRVSMRRVSRNAVLVEHTRAYICIF